MSEGDMDCKADGSPPTDTKAEPESKTTPAKQPEPCESAPQPPELYQTQDIIEMADTKLKVDGKILHASKLALCINSPVLKAMFKRHVKHKDKREIELPRKDYNCMLQFLEVLHDCESVNENNVVDILPICHEYQCKRLLKQCDEAVLARNRFDGTLEESIETLALASQYNLEEVKQKCVEGIKHVSSAKLKSCRDFQNIGTETYMKFLETSIQAKEEDLAEIAEIFSGESCDRDHDLASLPFMDVSSLNDNYACKKCKYLLYEKTKEIHERYDSA